MPDYRLNDPTAVAEGLSVAIAGVTGAVGREFLKLLESPAYAHWPLREVRLLASERSAGKTITFRGREHTIAALTPDALAGCDVALFSIGSDVSKQFAPICRELGCVMVDNSSAFRMDDRTPLVIPEINPAAAREHDGVIANPNCSTIIMLVPLWPLQREVGIRRIVVSTYQAVSGAGAAAMQELESQTADVLAGRPPTPREFPHPIAFNLFSHDSAIGEDGYNTEERKMIKETHKIFGVPTEGEGSVGVSPTCVRVPVLRSHAESINVELREPVDEARLRQLIEQQPGVRMVDDRAGNHFPMPVESSGGDDILVGRLRPDASLPPGVGWHLFVSGDQLLKGAAQNAVQIADLFIRTTSPASA